MLISGRVKRPGAVKFFILPIMQTCAIIETDEESEKTLRRYLWHISFLDIAWSYPTLDEAPDPADLKKVDLLFLGSPDDAAYVPNQKRDRLVARCGFVIVISSAPEDASYLGVSVLTYLRKPLAFDGFIKAIELFAAQ